jgi:hypothetical protein
VPLAKQAGTSGIILVTSTTYQGRADGDFADAGGDLLATVSYPDGNPSVNVAQFARDAMSPFLNVGYRGAQRAYLFDRARRRDDASAAVGQERRPGPACAGRGVLRPAVHQNRSYRVSERRGGVAAAPGLELSTGVAVAFPRSPFVTAATAWELQEASGGNFRLGLGGTQVRTHVVRRYGMAFDRPGPRLRDYVLAVKACFTAFRTGTLDHHGEFYDLDFIAPQWSAGPIDALDPAVDVAAVNPWMLRMAGEVADGVHVHPLGEPGYLSRHVMPNVAAGAEKSGWSPSDIAVIVPVMTIVGDSDEERHDECELVRASMSF